MKKYVPGLLAIMLAVTLCAAQRINSSKNVIRPHGDKKGMTFYWYRVNNVGVITSSSSIMFGGVPKDYPYADTHDGCNGFIFDCLRGYSEPILEWWFPYTGTGEITTERDEP